MVHSSLKLTLFVPTYRPPGSGVPVGKVDPSTSTEAPAADDTIGSQPTQLSPRQKQPSVVLVPVAPEASLKPEAFADMTMSGRTFTFQGVIFEKRTSHGLPVLSDSSACFLFSCC